MRDDYDADDPEGLSEDDIRRFGDDTDETGICPDCGGEVWDQADVCPHCGQHMITGPQRRSPQSARLTQRWVIVLVVLLILGLLACSILLF
jgi:hypothetical protein